MIRKIITEPDPLLRKKSKLIDKVDKKTQSLLKDMLETMYKAPGIGLAAIQIGIPLRLVVIDVSKEKEKDPQFLINPKIISTSENLTIYEEGCLSIPGQYAEISRPEKCEVKYLDYDGKKKTLKADGILSRCIQHEIDRLDGKLFIDYLSKLKKNMIIKKLTKQKKETERIVV